MRAADLLGPEGPLAAALEGYERRDSQLRMAERVEDALEHEGVALIEAGTGIGKTLAYLVPAILSGKRVVVSTGTRALQDQIMDKDLPFLRAHLGVPVEAACMKGLSNYLCRRRYRELLESPDAERPRLARRLPTVMDWVGSTEVADFAEVSALPEDDPLRLALSSSPDTRIGPRCAHFDECFVTAMRARAERARLVVVNHHLFFADLSVRGARGAGVIPDYDALIFDEAHQLEDVATLFFGASISDVALARLARDAERSLPSAGDVARSLSVASGALFEAVPRAVAGGGRAELPAGLFEGGPGEERYYALDAALEALDLCARREALDAGPGGARASIEQLARRAQRARDALSSVSGAGGSTVRWVERSERRLTLGSSPVDVSSLFRDEVVHRVPGLILTSATLTTGGSFDFVRRRLGIDFEVDEARLPSPFDYARQAALYLPPLPDPRSPAYPAAALDEIVRLVELTGGGGFVLSTSIRMMRRFAEGARPRLRGRPIYVQGEAPKGALLARFREDGDAVLFATKSFWEGVDVRGAALRLVVIDRLPFGVPSDPLVEARCRHIEEQGERAFIRYLVPSAALTLEQGFGRLIRTRRDHGVVAVLDSRISSKGYGKVFLRSLPPATRCESFEELRAFYARSAPVRGAGEGASGAAERPDLGGS